MERQIIYSSHSKIALAFLLFLSFLAPLSTYAQDRVSVPVYNNGSWGPGSYNESGSNITYSNTYYFINDVEGGAIVTPFYTLHFGIVAPSIYISPKGRSFIGEREYYEKITKAKEKAAQDGTVYEEPKLLSWDERGFANVGACEFIWYPSDVAAADKKFVEDWPTVRDCLQSQNIEIPKLGLGGAPWHSQEEFDIDLANLKKSDEEIGNPDQIVRKNELNELLAFLKREDVMKVQYGSLCDRLERAIDPNSEASMLKNLPPGKAEIIKENFDNVVVYDLLSDDRERYLVSDSFKDAANLRGLYALVDYCSFKGEGTAPAEHYNTQAWGLGEVLFQMKDLRSDVATRTDYIEKLHLKEKCADIDSNNLSSLEFFVIAGAKVLDDRIENNIIERNRIQGTPGYAEFIAHYGDENAVLTDAEKAAREKAFQSGFGLPYKDNSQYRETMFYPHVVGYLTWPAEVFPNASE